jgi:hypothetical protein
MVVHVIEKFAIISHISSYCLVGVTFALNQLVGLHLIKSYLQIKLYSSAVNNYLTV